MITKNIDYKAVAKMSDEKQFYIFLKKRVKRASFEGGRYGIEKDI